MQPVAAAFCFNDAYCPVAAAAVGSLIAHAGAGRHYDLYIVSPDLSAGSRGQLSAMTCGHDVTLEVVDFDVQERSGRRLGHAHYSSHVFTKLYLPQILSHLPRVLYLDSDTVVMADVASLYDCDLQGHAVGAVADASVDANPRGFGALCRNCGLPPHASMADYVTRHLGLEAGAVAGYFNSGVLLLDTARAAGPLERRLDELLEGHYAYPDQDILNVVFAADRLLLETRWNIHVTAASDADALARASILHYTGIPKPCDDIHPVTDRTLPYWQAIAATPFFAEALERYASARARAALRAMIKFNAMPGAGGGDPGRRP